MVNSARHTSKAAMRARAQEELIKRIKRYWQLYLLVLPPSSPPSSGITSRCTVL